MTTSIEKQQLNKKIDNACGKINKFLLSDYFPFFLAFLPVVFFFFNLQFIGISVMVAIAIYIVIKSDNFAPFIPLVLDIVMCIRHYDFTIIHILILSVYAITLLFAFIYRIIKFKIRFRYSSMYIPMLAVFISLLLGGIGSNYMSNYGEGMAIYLGIPFGSFVVVAIFASFIDYNDRFDYRRYLCLSIISMLFFAGIELILYNNGLLINYIKAPTGQYAWWNTPIFGQLGTLAIACSAYLFYKDKKILFPSLFIAYFIFISYYCKSRGALLVNICFIPFYIILLYRFVPFKTKQFFLAVVILVFVVAYLVLIKFGAQNLFYKIFARTSDTGRTQYYLLGTTIFLNNPIFGGGIASGVVENLSYYNFHSLLFHPLATTGIVGLCAMIFLHANRISIMGKRYDPFHICMMICYISYTVHSMIDCGEYIAIVLFYYLMIVIVEKTNDRADCMIIPPHYFALSKN